MADFSSLALFFQDFKAIERDWAEVGLIPYVGKPAQGIARAIRVGTKAAIKKALKAGKLALEIWAIWLWVKMVPMTRKSSSFLVGKLSNLGVDHFDPAIDGPALLHHSATAPATLLSVQPTRF